MPRAKPRPTDQLAPPQSRLYGVRILESQAGVLRDGYCWLRPGPAPAALSLAIKLATLVHLLVGVSHPDPETSSIFLLRVLIALTF